MPRSKETAYKRQRQSDDVVYIEPPPEHQFARFFSRFDDLNHYVFNFHDRTEISPRFRLLKNEYEVDSGTLSTIWGFDDLDTSNCVLFDGNKTPESWGPHVKRQAFKMFNIQRAHKKKILCNVFNLEMRLLHYLITYVLFLRSTGRAHTRIFKRLGIDFSNGSGRMLAQQHAIDIRALHHMGRNIQREEEEQAPPPQAQEPQEDQAGPSEQPSMRDMMEILQRMEINQQNLSQQIQSLQQEQGRMRRSIRRIEAYTFSEDEDEEQD
ncbi:hypothetical protein PIB30_102298 [Stylosanthes scabra]|uniref:Uncharacterized protein n=1 Tax=Stylosanthes scabra TaxID=79078 RepID=A0ABU6R098_9FABA|nr:hypothetical protein [Stylosanthes scabra]